MSEEKIVRFFSRHIVAILVTGHEGEIRHHTTVTAFVLSVSDRWFLITAGHNLKKIELIADSGIYDRVSWQLIDSLGEGAKYLEPNAFYFNPANTFYLSEAYPFDYGVIELSLYYQEHLQLNGIVALNEETWRKEPPTTFAHLLLGIPEELVEYDTEAELIRINAPVLIPVRHLEEKPALFDAVDFPLFYGHIETGGLSSIVGMSGGPILALHRTAEGETRYFLTALQSRWLPSTQDISGCPIWLLGEYLQSRIGTEE